MTNKEAKEVLQKALEHYKSLLKDKIYLDGETLKFIEATEIAIKAIEAQPCENCVRREAVIEWLKDKDIIKTKNQEENARRELVALPSVTPQTDVLDKIRGEINKARFVDKDTRICKNALASGLEVAMQIIDKYREDGGANDN